MDGLLSPKQAPQKVKALIISATVCVLIQERIDSSCCLWKASTEAATQYGAKLPN